MEKYRSNYPWYSSSMPGIFSAQNKRQYMRRIALGLCRSCGRKKPKPKKVLCTRCLKTKLDNYYENKEHNLEIQRKYRAGLRAQAFAAYGGALCSCCGEEREEFLTIDHEEGDGAAHRRQIGKSTHALLLWLKRHNYPAGFRILCMNCNFSIGIRGYCPHEKERKSCKMKKAG